MKKSYYPLLTICCLLLLTPSLLLSQENTEAPSADNKMLISSISATGNVSINSDEILSKVRSRVGRQFDAAIAAEDAKRIAELAGVEYSYYNTAVVEGKIKLAFIVIERNIVRSIVFNGNRKYKAGTLRGKLGFKKADYLEPVMAEAGRATIAEFYRKKGFAFAQVSLDAEKLSVGNVIYTIDEGPRVKMAAVRFSGNNALKTKSLKKVIKTKKTKWVFLSSYYTEEKVSKDVTKLQNIYYNRGFLDVSITAGREFTEDKSKVRITFAISEGHAYAVENIALAGNKNFDTEHLLSGLKLKQGQIYNKRKADSDVDQLLKLHREEGFIDAKVEQSIKFISEDKVDVEFGITEGERFRIGRISITGNEQIQDKAVRQVLNEYDFLPGRWYNADIAHGDGSGELEKEVRRMVVAESATITPRGETAGQKDADVSIIEGQTGMVMLGAGVTSDSGAVGQVIIEQRNFDISDRPESFSEFITGKAFRGAGQSMRIALQPGTEVSEYSINFTEPYFMNKPISLDVAGSSWERSRESYDENRLKGYVGFDKRYKNHWHRSLGIRMENVNINDVDSDAPSEITSVKGDNVLMGARLGVGRNLTDDRFNPTKGYNFEFGYEQVAGDHTFGILSGVYRRYQVLSEDLAERKTVLATKLLAASVIGDAPPFEKFYGGGTGTYGIRGFEYRGVSTRGGVDKDPIGSDWIVLANAEATVPLASDTFSILFFVDSGMIDTGGYRAAVGTGIQILIPQWFGPVPMRLEIAAPLMKDGDDETQVFSFSVGRLF
ncbi:MAG: POTRA domain-containing protein [Phycisphaerae bacterium]|nr:POTRA domain-containing protein [Phycisphaerae bacterium]MDD5380460.1 POTRA domain-containing protein [Phycisphaerae bacterium]